MVEIMRYLTNVCLNNNLSARVLSSVSSPVPLIWFRRSLPDLTHSLTLLLPLLMAVYPLSFASFSSPLFSTAQLSSLMLFACLLQRHLLLRFTSPLAHHFPAHHPPTCPAHLPGPTCPPTARPTARPSPAHSPATRPPTRRPLARPLRPPTRPPSSLLPLSPTCPLAVIRPIGFSPRVLYFRTALVTSCFCTCPPLATPRVERLYVLYNELWWYDHIKVLQIFFCDVLIIKTWLENLYCEMQHEKKGKMSAAASNGPHSGKPPEKSAVNVASNRMARGEALSGAEWTDEASGGGGAAPPRYSFKVGIYGWRKRCLYLLILGLLVMVIVNLALTLWEGMGQLRIVAGGVQLRGQALVLDALLASSIRSRYGQPLVLESSRNFTVNARGPDGRVAGRIFLGGDRVDCLSRSFRVTDARGATLFSADSREVVVGAEALRVTGEGGAIFDGTVQTPLVKADSGNELRLESPTRSLEVRAPLGVAIESRAGSISASCLADLKLQSLAGALIR
ncbi:Delta-sarcoglycan [Gryllus bimaculatus]|nr:Delta-sarcoglycan [Gryllus bimaculatus]